jgi:thiamine biosynthesis lipoprotein
VPVDHLSDTVVASTRAMASAITVTVPRATSYLDSIDTLMRHTLDVFGEVEEACTRFDSSSPLMRANATPTRWHRVPPVLYRALEEAYDAYRRTNGVFDPRVLGDLVALGYDATMRFGEGEIQLDELASRPARRREAWRPRFRVHKSGVWLGETVELGGIGKGLAVRWASDVLATQLSNYLVEAGGDCYVAGFAPDGGKWRVGVENPCGSDDPVAVLALSDLAVATSSVRLRHWRAGDEVVHHLIDPTSGRSGGEGLLAVTVVGSDPAAAEVETKVLFLAGRERIADVAHTRHVAALWCHDDGAVSTSAAMNPHVLWRQP